MESKTHHVAYHTLLKSFQLRWILKAEALPLKLEVLGTVHSAKEVAGGLL